MTSPRQPIRLVDTSLRDGNQSLLGCHGAHGPHGGGGRASSGPGGLRSIDFTSSTNLSVGVKWHQENPWERIYVCRDGTPNTATLRYHTDALSCPGEGQ